MATRAERPSAEPRSGRLLGFGELEPAIELVRGARSALAAGSLGYALFLAGG